MPNFLKLKDVVRDLFLVLVGVVKMYFVKSFDCKSFHRPNAFDDTL